MFYEASELDKLLDCKICERKLDDPRILPCGRSFCNKCIFTIADTEKTRIKCLECAKIHEIPEQGFPCNFEVNSILKLKSNEVYRSKLVNEFKNIVNSVRFKNEKIYVNLIIGESLIRDQCDKVRNEAQMEIEEAHLKLDRFHKSFMDEIDEYERECQEEFKQIQRNKSGIEKLLNESLEFCVTSETLLKKFQIDEEDIRIRLNKAYNYLNGLEKIGDKLQSNMFNGTLLKFNKSLKEIKISSIGTIKRQNLNLYYLENLCDIREIKLQFAKADLNEKFPFIIAQPFRSYLLLFLQLRQDNTLNISVLDKMGNMQLERNIPLINRLLRMYITSLVQNSFFCAYTEEEIALGHQRVFKLQSFDDNLNFISKRYFQNSLKFVDSTNDCVFVSYRENNYLVIALFNSKLEPIQVYGQANKVAPFYFSLNIAKLLVNQNYFIKSEPLPKNLQFRITLIEKSNGLIRNHFDVNLFSNWCLYLEEFILLFDSTNIFCYNFDGKLIEITTVNAKNLSMSAFKFSLNKELYFLDCDRENNKIRLSSF
jgi:hypothetical protein